MQSDLRATFLLFNIHIDVHPRNIYREYLWETAAWNQLYELTDAKQRLLFYLLSSCYKLPWTTGEQFYVCSIIQCIILHENLPFLYTPVLCIWLFFVLDVQCFHFLETSFLHLKSRQNISVFLFPDSCHVYSFHSFFRLIFCIAYIEDLLLKGRWFRYRILTRQFSWKIVDFLKTQDFVRLVKSENFLTKRSFTIYIYIFLRNFEIFFMTNKVCKCSRKRIIWDIIKICKYSNMLVSNKFWEFPFKYYLMYNFCSEISRSFVYFKLDNFEIYNFFSKGECHSVFETWKRRGIKCTRSQNHCIKQTTKFSILNFNIRWGHTC